MLTGIRIYGRRFSGGYMADDSEYCGGGMDAQEQPAVLAVNLSVVGPDPKPQNAQ
jgi:hypothetical protein